MLAGFYRLTGRLTRLEAALKGVAGFTGSGVVRYQRRADGRRLIEAGLSGLAGVRAEIVVRQAPVGAIACRDGEATGRLDSRAGAPIPPLEAGDAIEIRQNGVPVLRGVLARA